MKQLRFTLSGTCLVPDACTESDLANHIRLPGGQVISIHPVIEMVSGPDADDPRDLSYDEAVALDLYLEIEERSSDLGEVAM